MPCLNEAETIGTCVEKARAALAANGIAGEVVVADNGSTDGSPEIAERLGARVVRIPTRGYGSALMGGFAAARGKYVLMGDADDSYDFGEAPRFLEKLRQGYDLVQGCRLSSGGGRIEPGAMPFLHRWLGNPVFSLMARSWFKAPIHDVNCGLRALSKAHFERLDQRCEGMEFAVEMIIKSSLQGARIGEVPITLRQDGRTVHAAHLRTFPDGWRTLRFFLLYSPRWLFLLPGAALILFGLICYVLGLPGLRLGPARFDVHTLLFGSLAIICGYQSILFAVFTKTYAVSAGLIPEDRRITRLYQVVNLEKGLLAGAVMMLFGFVLLIYAINQWRLQAFGPLDASHTMKRVIPGVTLFTLGFQTILYSFFLSVLGIRQR